jgi:hypothetical protein
MPKDLIRELGEMPETGARLMDVIRLLFPEQSPEKLAMLRKHRSPFSQFTPEEMEDYPEGTITPERPVLDPYSGILPMGTIKGVKSAIELAEAGAVTGKGRPVMEKVLNWFKDKYEGKLWEDPGAGFVRRGAYGRYHRLKGQAPGAGVKVARADQSSALSGEVRFLRAFHNNPEVGRRIYNADPILMEYMPKFHTMPQEGSQFLFTKAMKPMEWSKLKELPVHKQRQMFINFVHHARRLGKRLEKYEIHLGDVA